jgi:hypothetical protein
MTTKDDTGSLQNSPFKTNAAVPSQPLLLPAPNPNHRFTASSPTSQLTAVQENIFGASVRTNGGAQTCAIYVDRQTTVRWRSCAQPVKPTLALSTFNPDKH